MDNIPTAVEYNGYKISYSGRFNLISIEGIPDNQFTSFDKAIAWLDNPQNQAEVNRAKVVTAPKEKPLVSEATRSATKPTKA